MVTLRKRCIISFIFTEETQGRKQYESVNYIFYLVFLTYPKQKHGKATKQKILKT